MILTHLLTIVLILGIIKGTTQRPCLSPCSPEDDLNTCMFGDWQCNVNEFCEIVIHDMISLNCKHTEPELQRCQERNASNSDTCVIPTLPSEHACHYCCEDDQCVRILSESVVSISASQDPTSENVVSTLASSDPTSENVVPTHARHSCYSSTCNHGDSLSTCSSGQWACQNEEFCQITVHGNVDMGCKVLTEMQHCQNESDKNHEACDPAVIPSVHSCHYCCENDLCVQDLTVSEVLTSSNQDLLFSATTLATILPLDPTSEDVVPTHARHSCYSSTCNHGDSLSTCSSGQWACQSEEFCQITVHDNVDMGCKVLREFQHCQTENAKNHEACNPAVIPSAHACHYCCENDLCVQDMTVSEVLTSSNQDLLFSATTLITTLQTTLPSLGDLLKRDMSSFESSDGASVCVDHYTGNCSVDFPGQCDDPLIHEICLQTCGYCKYVTTECFDHYLGNCTADFPGGCDDLFISAICPRTCQSCPNVTSECRDHYIGSCIDDFKDNCNDTLIRAICPKTCRVCNHEPPTALPTDEPPTALPTDVTSECRDHYIGSCTDDFKDNCDDALIQAICPKTCRVCNHVTSECRDHYIGSCTDDFKDNCDDALIQAICPKTCGVCNQELTTLEQTSITLPPTTEELTTLEQTSITLPPTTEETTSTTASTTVAPTSGSCVQCGEPEFSVPCSSMELLLDTPSPCMEPGKFLCMTDAATDSDGVTSIYKRCVDQSTCHTLWYLESSDQNVCRNFDSVTTDVSCHFCCIQDGCNTGTIPSENTLYNGHL